MENTNNKKIASSEMIQNLCNIGKKRFDMSFSLLSDSIATYKRISEINTVCNENSELLLFWKKLLKLDIYTQLVNLDIYSVFRASFKSQSQTEKRSNLKYVNVITLEGYRYMFGSQKDKLNAVWTEVQDAIKQFSIKHNDPELITDLDIIKSKAEAFKHTYATQKDVNNRNLAIHYDINPIKVWIYMCQIEDEDYECKRISAFLSYLEAISCFITKCMLKYSIPLYCVKADIDLTIRDVIIGLNDKDDRVYDASGSALLTYGKAIDSMMHQYNEVIETIELINKKANVDIVSNIPEEQLESIYPGIHIAFLYIDIATASRAYLKSEHYAEKILNLRRINVIVYEGFKKLYGFSEVQKGNSFWKKNICSILDNVEDETLKANINSIENKLKIITQDPIINNFDLRGFSVHYRYEGDDNLIPLYDELLKFNMFSELAKAKIMLDILPPLLEMTTNAMACKNAEDNAKIAQQLDDFTTNFNAIIDTLSNQPSSPAEYKDKFIDAKEKFKIMIEKFKL